MDATKQAALKKRWEAEGRCNKCGSPDRLPGLKRCQKCKEWESAYRKDQRAGLAGGAMRTLTPEEAADRREVVRAILGGLRERLALSLAAVPRQEWRPLSERLAESLAAAARAEAAATKEA